MSNSISTWFGFTKSSQSDELPEIFPLSIQSHFFVKTDTLNIYQKILTDVIERTEGIPEDKTSILFDNCLQSESSFGLITLLSDAMAEKKDLFIVYNAALNVIRLADFSESQQIRTDYEKTGKSSLGIFISFKNYSRSDMVKIYSAMEYCVLGSLNKSMNLSKAVQIKISDMRASVSLKDSAEAKAQGVEVARALANGKDVMIDAKDKIETVLPDLKAIDASIQFINQKQAFYLGMPSSYLDGEQTTGIGSTGEQDTRAVERGLKNYYFSIIKPVIEAIFQVKTRFKSQDFRMLSGSLEVLKTFELISEDLISLEDKQNIIKMLFDTEGKNVDSVRSEQANPQNSARQENQAPNQR